MKNVTLIIAVALTVAAQTAAAQQAMNFSQLKEACLNPAKFQNQIQPTNIKIDCSDRQVTWVASADDQTNLPGLRVVGHSVSSDKYAVALTKEQVKIDSTVVACPVMKQIEETIATAQSLTCAQITSFQGTATELCTQVIDQLRVNNPAAILTKETGKVVHLCKPADSGNGDNGQRDGRGQREQR